MHQNLQFKKMEQNKLLNYLDVTIHRNPSNIKISIYRKPTFTDILIPYISKRPIQRKYAVIRFSCSRLNSYKLHEKEYQEEENISYILIPFHYHPISNTLPKKHQSQQTQGNKHRWTTFTYVGKETTYNTKIFKNTNLRIAFHTKNILRKHSKHNT